MRLEQLIDGFHVRVVQGDAKRSIRDLTDDSREVAAGSLFIARTGSETDGRGFIQAAIERGAVAVLAETPIAKPIPDHVTLLNAGQVDQAIAGQLAERFFGQPSRKLRLIGITGTNGKTTTAWIVRHLLQAADLRCGLIGTIAIDDGGGVPSSKSQGPSCRHPQNSKLPTNTTPGSIAFSRLLARMVANGCQAAVAEVSSHALHQGRADALRFDAAVFTNLSGDHLDYHQTMDAYAAAKARLFRLIKPDGWAVVNGGDTYTDAMLAALPAGHSRIMRCRRHEIDPADHATVVTPSPQHVTATLLHASAEGSRASFDGPWGSVEAMLPLVGPHNVTNALQAIAAAHAVCDLGQSLHTALLRCPPVPGRLEKVSNSEFRVPSDWHAASEQSPARETPNSKPPTVLVDYAHTHDALKNVLSALRPLTTGRLIVLFGCGGDRDATKRPKMARVAQQWADVIHVTSDNPRTEDPQRIIDDIVAGFDDLQSAKVEIRIEPDRARAIAAAVDAAEPGDTVLLAGKGHEDYQIIGKDRRPFDDREHAATALAQWQARRAALGNRTTATGHG